MKNVFYLSVITLILFGCKSKPDNSTKIKHHKTPEHIITSNEDTTEVDPSTLAGCLPTSFKYRGGGSDEFYPGTFNDKTYVYSSIRPGAKITDSLTFNTSVNVLKEYSDFYLVCTPHAKAGYIKRTDLYLHKIFNSSGVNDYYYYLVGITKYPKKEDREWGNDCHNSLLKIVKIDEKTSKRLDVYKDSIVAVSYTVSSVNMLALKNAKALFHITYNCYNELETDNELFVVDNGKKIQTLLLTSSTGDGGYGDGSDIYLPITLINGKKIVLAKNGVVTIDNTNLKPEVLPYPADIGVPIEELVVEQFWNEADDSEGDQKYNADGTGINYTTITSTIYYRWDGNTLKKVKEVKGSGN